MKADKKSMKVAVALAILLYLAYGPFIYSGIPEPKIYNNLEVIKIDI